MKIEKQLKLEIRLKTKIPLCLTKVAAGFPSPADDYAENRLDLNEHLIQNPASTFFMKVSGDSMTGAGIFSGDMLIVDKSATAKNGAIVIAIIFGEMTVKRIQFKENQILLVPENTDYSTITITDKNDLEIWGVVKYVIHKT